MPEMDQSRLTTEELAFLQALDDQAREFQENATAFARQLGEDFAECLRIIRRLAGDKPPADSIRVEREQAERIRRIAVRRLDRDLGPLLLAFDAMPNGPEKGAAMSAAHSIFNGFSAIRDEIDNVLECVYVPAGAEPDREGEDPLPAPEVPLEERGNVDRNPYGDFS